MPQRKRGGNVTQQQLFTAWSDADLTVCEVARAIGVTDRTLRSLAREHQLPPRPVVDWRLRDDKGGPPDLWGEPEGGDSLDLCPWVQARIAALRLHDRVRETVQ
jgi:hypothetical protein